MPFEEQEETTRVTHWIINLFYFIAGRHGIEIPETHGFFVTITEYIQKEKEYYGTRTTTTQQISEQ